MTSIKISQLVAVDAATSDDVFIINDGDVNTKKITFADLTQDLIGNAGSQTITGDLTVSAALSAGSLNVDTGVLVVNSTNDRVGVNIGATAAGFTLDVGGSTNIRGGAALRLSNADNTQYVSLQAPALTSSSVYALPPAYPTTGGQVLASSTTGAMSWVLSATDPMSSVGDMIYNGATSTTSALSIGTAGQVLTSNGTIPVWAASPSGFPNPMSTAGDIIINNASNVTSRLGIGATGEVLAVQANGTPGWQTASVGMTDPMTTIGDMIFKNSGNTTTRLPTGTTGQVLTIQANSTPAWQAIPPGFVNPMTTIGDMIYQDASNVTTRLATGSPGEVLTIQGNNTPAWQAAASSFTDPMTTAGDLIVRNASNATTRLGLGTAAQVLQVNAGATEVVWGTVPAAASQATTFTWNSSILPTVNESYDLGSAEYKVRHLFLSDNSIKFESGDLGVAAGELTWKGTAFTPASGVGYEVKPTISAVQPATVLQGQQWQATQTGDSDIVDGVWSFYGYTGSGSYSKSSSAGTVIGIENTPGTYTVNARQAWAFGVSDPVTLTVQVNPFTLTRTTMFGGIDGLQGRFNLSSVDTTDYIAITGAVVDPGSGSYVWDADGSVQSEAANCIALYSYTRDILVAFRISATNTFEQVASHPSVATLPTQGQVPNSGSFTTYLTVSSQKDAAVASAVLGKHVPLGGQYTQGLGSQHYLKLTPAVPTTYAGFGSSNANWSYGFRLTDDWMANGYGNQMLAPGSDSEFFLNTINGLGISSNPFESVIYGNNTAGPFDSSTNAATWDISSANWKIASAGDLVVVTFNTTGSLWAVYVEGTKIYENNSVYVYMPSAVTTATTLEFGNFSRALGMIAYQTGDKQPAGWYSRLDSLFVSVGTAFDASQVTSLVTHKADLTAAPEYPLMTSLGVFDDNVIQDTKGGITYTRESFGF